MYCQYMKTTKYYEYETFIIVYLFKGYSICKIHGRGHFFLGQIRIVVYFGLCGLLRLIIL